MPELLKGKYVLDQCIGRGGMAEVFAARTLGAAGFSQRVAIKRILSAYILDARFREMFVSEARLSSHLRHSNIVRVFDFDEDAAGNLFLVMEYVDGVDLGRLVGTGLLPLPVVLLIVSEILRGLAYVHELPLVEGSPRGLVHRDISPQNVLLSWDGAVQISDFGIAKARTATQAGASVMIKGKPAYMSPEQAGGLALDGRSDVFAVGIMLWEMLCGEPLFADSDDMRATLAAVMFSDVPPPSAWSRRPVPEDVERVTMQMLRRGREERYDAAAALDVLTACADFPKSGREALAALMAERLPERAPRRAAPRRPRSEPSPGERAAAPHAADAEPPVTPVAVLPGRHQARPIRHRGSVLARARRRTLWPVLLGAIVIGALTSGGLHVMLGSSSSAAQSAPVPSGPNRPDSIEHARVPDEVPAVPPPRAEPAPAPALPARRAAPREVQVDAPHPTRGDASQPTGRAATLDKPAPAELSRRGDASPTERKTPALPPVPARPPAKAGMQIIDLRPETPETPEP
ncbi:MAG TPA: serine/threonine-protein kinase [Kofleriaceae bacterium]|nr:serine/threonine-protein kinase [Kofleriaceae bacterium]